MRMKLHRRLTAAFCALVLLLSLPPAARAVSEPRTSNNIRTGDYNSYSAHTVKSYLYANEKGGLTRVEYIDTKLVVEEYSSAFQLQSSHVFDRELPVWGGFYAGSQYNFAVYGEFNAAPDAAKDSSEVIRVVKYDKNWNRLGAANVYGANTVGPFNNGSLRCTEADGLLYVHTSHTMYKSSDGKNHQANMILVIRESDMTVTQTNATVGGYAGYVSHSFNQFILTDQNGNVLAANHGDGHPRAMVIDQITGGRGRATTDTFPGAIGQNRTGARLGGFVETSSGYLLSYYQDSAGKLAYVAKSAFGSSSSFQVRQVAAYSTDDDVSTELPRLVPTSLSGGYVIWASARSMPVVDPVSGWTVSKMGDETIHYASYDASGQPGQVRTAPGAMSDCQPIVFNGKVVWYVTSQTAPVFYTLDASGVTATPANSSASTPGAPVAPSTPSKPSAFRDLPNSHWALSDVQACVDAGVVGGYEDGSFGPNDPVTSVQFVAMLTRTFYANEVTAVTTPAGEQWYYPNMKVAKDHGLLGRAGVIDDQPMSRYAMAEVLLNVLVEQKRESVGDGVDINEITDYAEFKDGKHFNAVISCYSFGILTGKEDGAFHGDQNMTRAEACVVINRMMKLING